jgi:hypothetical protein
MPERTSAERAQGKDSKSEKMRMVTGAEEEPREVVGVDGLRESLAEATSLPVPPVCARHGVIARVAPSARLANNFELSGGVTESHSFLNAPRFLRLLGRAQHLRIRWHPRFRSPETYSLIESALAVREGRCPR